MVRAEWTVVLAKDPLGEREGSAYSQKEGPGVLLVTLQADRGN